MVIAAHPGIFLIGVVKVIYMNLVYLAGVTDPFGRNHLILAALCIVLIVGLSIVIAKTDIKFSTLLNLMLILWVCSETTKLVGNMEYLLSDGSTIEILKYKAQEGISIVRAFYPRSALPFHLCSIQPIFILIVKLTKNDKLKDTLLKFIFPTATLGAVIAILVGTVGGDFADPHVYEYFFFHAGLTIFAISIVTKKQIEITFNSHLKTSLMIFLMFVGSIWINSILSDTYASSDDFYTNFFYSMQPPLENLPVLNLNYGWFVYFFTICGIGIVAITLLQLPFIIKSIKNRK